VDIIILPRKLKRRLQTVIMLKTGVGRFAAVWVGFGAGVEFPALLQS